MNNQSVEITYIALRYMHIYTCLSLTINKSWTHWQSEIVNKSKKTHVIFTCLYAEKSINGCYTVVYVNFVISR